MPLPESLGRRIFVERRSLVPKILGPARANKPFQRGADYAGSFPPIFSSVVRVRKEFAKSVAFKDVVSRL